MKKNLVSSALLVGIGMFTGILLVTNWLPGSLSSIFADSKQIGASSAPAPMNAQLKLLNEGFVSASNAVLPSVVNISVEVSVDGKKSMRGLDEFFRFFGQPNGDGEDGGFPPEQFLQRGSGSGVIVTSDGYIVTNNHVVEDAVDEGIKVTLYDKKEYTARLIGTDPLTDLALIKIDADGLQAAHFASIEDVKVGEFVVAVGNPLGLSSTVTTGIVSSIGRGGMNLNKDRYAVENYIQTDAAINPGNSGGGLFDLNGSLVGINSAIATETGNYIGYGFAIPVDLTKSVIEDLIEDGIVDRGYIGVSITSVKDETEAKALGLSDVAGVKVEGLVKSGAAESAGLEIGDVITEVNGAKVRTSNELQSRIAMKRAGDKVRLTIVRDGKKMEKSVVLKAKDGTATVASNDKKRDSDEDRNEPVELKDFGFTVKPLDGKTKEDFDVQEGVFISDVKRYGLAQNRGMFPNGVIVKADRKNISSPKELEDLLRSKKPGEAILLQVKYAEANRMIAIEVPQKKG